MSHSITVESGKSLKLKTAGKYCDRDIVVYANGSTATFYGYSEITKNNILQPLTKVSLPNATILGIEVFEECSNLTEIEALNVVSLGELCFRFCTSLTNIIMPQLEQTGFISFGNCTSIENINFPSLVYVGSHSFLGCSNLREINLPKCKDIGDNAFQDCVSLTRLDLPLVNYIAGQAFLNCTNLSAVIFRTTEEPCVVQVDSFLNTKIMDENGMPTGQGFAYYPTSMDEAYRAVYEPAFAEMGMPGAFDYLFRKIEDYPEITGG